MTTTPTTTQKRSSKWQQLVRAATAAYWHPCFSDHIIDAPERMEAALAIVIQTLNSWETNDSV